MLNKFLVLTEYTYFYIYGLYYTTYTIYGVILATIQLFGYQGLFSLFSKEL